MKRTKFWVGATALMLLWGAETGGDPGIPATKPDDVPAASGPVQGSDPLFDDDYDDEDENAAGSVSDPLEATNRSILGANQVMDRFFFDPVTRGYGLAPNILKQGIRNMFSNLDSPAVFTNDVLQLEWKDAGVTAIRLLVNSTMGFAGFFDVATEMGLEKHDSGFGQTLALAGIPSGAYVVVPVLGPTSVRDGMGAVVDIAMSPTVYLLGPVVLLYYGGSVGIALREENLQKLDALKSSSIDYYSTLRSAWWQNRNAEIWARREHRRADSDYGP